MRGGIARGHYRDRPNVAQRCGDGRSPIWAHRLLAGTAPQMELSQRTAAPLWAGGAISHGPIASKGRFPGLRRSG